MIPTMNPSTSRTARMMMGLLASAVLLVVPMAAHAGMVGKIAAKVGGKIDSKAQKLGNGISKWGEKHDFGKVKEFGNGLRVKGQQLGARVQTTPERMSNAVHNRFASSKSNLDKGKTGVKAWIGDKRAQVAAKVTIAGANLSANLGQKIGGKNTTVYQNTSVSTHAEYSSEQTQRKLGGNGTTTETTRNVDRLANNRGLNIGGVTTSTTVRPRQ